MKLLILSGGRHPYHETTPVLHDFLSTAGHDVTTTEDPTWLAASAMLKDYDGLVFNTRREHVPGSDDLTLGMAERQGLQNFVASGKGFICLHVSSCVATDWPEYHDITGGGWVSGTSYHPPYREINVHVSAPSHPVACGLTDFTTHDELYMNVAMRPGNDLFLTADAETESHPYGPERTLTHMPGGTHPLGWTRQYGEGRVFVLLLGHDMRSFQNTGFQRLVLNGVHWATAPSI